MIDTDGALSDAFGMNLAITAAKLGLGPPIIGITCVRGPFTSVELACKNVATLLYLLDSTDIPIYYGANTSLVITPPERVSQFGADAFGDLQIDEYVLPKPQKENAISAMTRLARNNKGKIIFLGMAPVTNYALAQQLDNEFLSNVNVLLTSCGNVQGIGDFAPGIESKSIQDPEAAKYLFNHSNYKKLDQLPYEAIYETDNAIPKEFWDKFYALPGTSVLARISRIYLENGAPSGYVFGDPLLTAAYISPNIVSGVIPLRSNVVLCGDGRGAFLIDWKNKDVDVQTSNMLSLRDIDACNFQSFLLKVFDN